MIHTLGRSGRSEDSRENRLVAEFTDEGCKVTFVDRPHYDSDGCAFCAGDGEVVNPGNGDATVAVVDWLRPVICPRCGGTGKEPNEG